MISRNGFQGTGDVLQGRLPVCLEPLTLLLDHRNSQTLRTVHTFVGKTVAVTDPAFINSFIFQGHDPHHSVGLGLCCGVGAEAVVRTQ